MPDDATAAGALRSLICAHGGAPGSFAADASMGDASGGLELEHVAVDGAVVASRAPWLPSLCGDSLVDAAISGEDTGRGPICAEDADDDGLCDGGGEQTWFVAMAGIVGGHAPCVDAAHVE